MRKLVYPIVFGVVFAATATVGHAEEIFLGRVTGGQETPPVMTSGRGFVMAAINDTMDSITFVVAYDNLNTNAMLAHFHVGPPGVAGPIIFNIGPPEADTGGIIARTLTAADFTPAGGVDSFREALQAFRDGNIYVNIHSVSSPPGEIRGQLRQF